MKKLMFTCALVAASCAFGEWNMSAISEYSYSNQVNKADGEKIKALEKCYDMAIGFVKAEKTKDYDSDVVYSFKMTTKTLEASDKAQKASEFIEALPAGVHYYEAKTHTVQGMIWSKARPCWLAQVLLNVNWGLAPEMMAMIKKYSAYAGILPDVRAVSIWDAKNRSYVDNSLFYFCAAGMGAGCKESFGLFLGVNGVDTAKAAEYWKDWYCPAKDVTDLQGALTNLIDGLEDNCGIVLGMGVGKTVLNKNARYISSLAGNSLFIGTDVTDINLKELVTGGSFKSYQTNAFYNVYSREVLQVPVNVNLGFGTWQMTAMTSLSKALSKKATEAEKLDLFTKKCYKRNFTGPAVLDQWRLVLAAAVSGDGPLAAKKSVADSQKMLEALKIECAGNQLYLKWIETVQEFHDLLDDYCDQAYNLGIHEREFTAE